MIARSMASWFRSTVVFALAFLFAATVIGDDLGPRPLAPAVTRVQAKDAHRILSEAGIKGGLVVHLGCGDGKLTAALRASDSYLVHGLDADGGNLNKARKHIQSLGLYGKVSVDTFDGMHLPYTDNLVNLVVADSLGQVPMSEVMRVLAPLGVALIDGEKTVKPRPADIDEWTHYLHGPDNNAVANDKIVGQPRSMQWVAPPRFGRSHEELASISAFVSARGRVFYIIDEGVLASIRYPSDWKLVARDAFNGTLLWKKPISANWTDHLRHFRSGPVHLPRRLTAVGDRVFVTLGLDAPVTMLDAASGRILKTYEGTEYTEEITFNGTSLYLVVGTSEIYRTGEGLFERGEPKPSQKRFVMALNPDSGNELWRKDCSGENYILPLTMAVNNKHLVYRNLQGIVCLEAPSGKPLWFAKRQTPIRRMGFSTPTLVLTDDVVLCADKVITSKKKEVETAKDRIEWGVHGWNLEGFGRGDKTSELIAYSIEDGDELWSASCGEGYNSPVDIFVIDNAVFVGPQFAESYDLKSGEKVRSIQTKSDKVLMAHHRCYRDKATTEYILTGKSGVEFIDLEEGWVGNNSWVRGVCQNGIVPANGFLYAPPSACACAGKAMLQGLNVLSSNLPASVGKPLQMNGRLTKGRAFERIEKLLALSPLSSTDAWPMFRNNASRSGSTSGKIPSSLQSAWSATIGGRLTQPVIAHGKAVVASIDKHTIYAFDIRNGDLQWAYTAGGRIDSPPTFYRGMILFGSADGRVYCLDVMNGDEVWCFEAAPERRYVVSHDQLESAWPVNGAVLIHNDQLYFSAGRSTYLDGGIDIYRVDPKNGNVLAHRRLANIDPVSNKQMEPEGKFDMEGSVSDILSMDGGLLFLKHIALDPENLEKREPANHLFSSKGLLGDEWFVRTYWIYGSTFDSGWGKWALAGSMYPAGRILCFDEERLYGYGRMEYASGATGHKAMDYHLYASKRVAEGVDSGNSSKNEKNSGKSKSAKQYFWNHNIPLTVRAMVAGSENMAIAGVPDLAEKASDVLEYINPKEAQAAYDGERGAFLWVVSKADGTKLFECELKAPPIFDGIAATDGKIFISLENGSLMCMNSM